MLGEEFTCDVQMSTAGHGGSFTLSSLAESTIGTVYRPCIRMTVYLSLGCMRHHTHVTFSAHVGMSLYARHLALHSPWCFLPLSPLAFMGTASNRNLSISSASGCGVSISTRGELHSLNTRIKTSLKFFNDLANKIHHLN
jgi:hypothetical protein